MTADSGSVLENVAMGLAAVGLVVLVASFFVESVSVRGVSLGLSLAANGVIVAAFALLATSTLVGTGNWWYPPLFLVITGNFIQILVGPTDSNPLETVGFGVTLVGCAALLLLAWQRNDGSAPAG